MTAQDWLLVKRRSPHEDGINPIDVYSGQKRWVGRLQLNADELTEFKQALKLLAKAQQSVVQ